MNAPEPHEFSEELLAAYADGELNATEIERVELWLAHHPEAMEDLRNQRELSASNFVFWDAVQPAEPNSAVWSVVRQEIETELSGQSPAAARRPRISRAVGWVLSSLVAGSAAAAIAWTTITSTPPLPAPASHKPVELVQNPDRDPEVGPAPRIVSEPLDPLAAIAVLPMPSDDDVVLDRVPALNDGWLPVGQHPAPGMLTLASVDDVYLEDVSPSPAWPASSGPKMTTGPGDSPMIYAAKQR